MKKLIWEIGGLGCNLFQRITPSKTKEEKYLIFECLSDGEIVFEPSVPGLTLSFSKDKQNWMNTNNVSVKLGEIWYCKGKCCSGMASICGNQYIQGIGLFCNSTISFNLSGYVSALFDIRPKSNEALKITHAYCKILDLFTDKNISDEIYDKSLDEIYTAYNMRFLENWYYSLLTCLYLTEAEIYSALRSTLVLYAEDSPLEEFDFIFDTTLSDKEVCTTFVTIESGIQEEDIILGLCIYYNLEIRSPHTYIIPNAMELFSSTNVINASNFIVDCNIAACMFDSCTKLVNPPQLPEKELTISSYSSMFLYCKSLLIAPVLPALTLKEGCYYRMFYNCSSLNYVEMLATNVAVDGGLYHFILNVAPLGTFVKAKDVELPEDTIPEGWIIKEV